MHLRSWSLPVVCAAVLLACRGARAVEVALVVADDADTARRAGIVSGGVPFARGACRDVRRLSVWAGGRAVPAQFTMLAPWDDGSVRWALMDCQVDVPAGGKAQLLVRDDAKGALPPAPVQVVDGAESVELSTGPLTLSLPKKRPGLVGSLKVDGKELVTSGGRGLVIYTHDGRAVAASPPTRVTIEQAGPLKAIVCLKGRYPGVHDGLMGYTVRVAAYAGQKLVRVHAWLENDGAHGYAPRDHPWKPEWFAFDGMAVELGLDLGGGIRARCEGVEAAGKLKVLQVVRPPKDEREPSYTLKDFEYRITADGEELKKGGRTNGMVALAGAHGKLTVAIRHFWQNYEKAIELDGQTLKLWLWPTEGRYPRFIPGDHPCPGFATRMMNALRKDGLYNMPGAIHKGHEMVLDFSGRDAAQTLAETSHPLFPLASAEHYAATEASPGLFAPPTVRTGDAECDAKLDAWMRMTRSVADPASASSIWFARRTRNTPRALWTEGFWYGWMDFGDLAVPGSAAVSLHYDWPWVMLVNAMRTGDLHFLRLATEMARHRIDVDQQWSDREQPAYRGFQRVGYSYAHFHCQRFTYSQPSVDSTWLAGVVLHYLLTGEPKALECIERGSKALREGWARMAPSKDYYVRRKLGDMQMAARSIFAYCALFDLTADRTWLDEALKLFRTHVVAKWKDCGPHLHRREQIRSQDYIRDDIKYCYSLQALCELHHRTADAKLLELLKAGCDTEFPENFFDAPLFLANLNAYVALKTGSRDYLEDAIEHWIEAFPESQCPPVYMPGNSQWSRRKAMLLRTGHLLQYACWKQRGAPHPSRGR